MSIEIMAGRALSREELDKVVGGQAVSAKPMAVASAPVVVDSGVLDSQRFAPTQSSALAPIGVMAPSK
ncbi:MAG: hypothetical protein K6G84_13155 [Lachnospiraceae bacterium]|nr:hypothetical protein [Lachnospiraceae bacterium]